VIRSLLDDIRQSARALAHAPAFSALAIGTLALGMAAAVSIFSLLKPLLLRPLPYKDPDSLVYLRRIRITADRAPLSGPDFIDFRRNSKTLADATVIGVPASLNLGGLNEPMHVIGSRVAPNVLQLLGVHPIAGASPTVPGEEIIISRRLWKQLFASDPHAIGKTVRLDMKRVRIAAVVDDDVMFPPTSDLWLPIRLTDEVLGNRAYHQFHMIGRLRRGATVEEADAEAGRIAGWLSSKYPESDRGVGAHALALHDMLAEAVRPALVVMSIAVLFLLLIACSNVANLLLVRAAGRQQEFAMRRAVGATTARLVRQMIIDGVLIALIAGAIGLGAAQLVVDAGQKLAVGYLPRPEVIVIDGGVAMFAVLLSLVTGTLFGLAPVLAIGSTMDTLRGGTRAEAATGWKSRAVRESVIVAIVALSFVLLTGAGLLVRSFIYLRSINTTIDVDKLMTAEIALPDLSYPDPLSRTRFFTRLLDALRATPGIDSVACSAGVPLENTSSGFVTRPGTDPSLPRQIATFTLVSSGYFRTTGIALLEGRDFNDNDVRMLLDPNVNSLLPIVINRTLASRFLPGRHPIGAHLFVGGSAEAEVIGVVTDVRPLGNAREITSQLYLPLGTPMPPRAMSILVRSPLSGAAIVDTLRRRVQEIDGEVPLYKVRSMRRVVDDSVTGAQLQMMIIGAFAAIALLLAVIGVYGVVSYSMAQRTRELGIRIAVGAAPADLVRMVYRRSIRIALTGTAIGIAGSLALSRTMEALLYGVTPFDPLVHAAVAIVLIGCCIASSIIPALRASRVQPTVSLRYE